MKVTDLEAAIAEATGTLSFKFRDIRSTMKLNDVSLRRCTCQCLWWYI